MRELWIQRRMRSEDAPADPTYAGMLFGSTLAIVLAFAAASLDARLPGPPALPFAVGLALMLGGFALRAWAVHTLGRFFRVEVTIAADHRVVDSGPYAWLRHPSYTGMLVVYLGLGVGLDSWLSVAAMLLPLVAVVRRIDHEEGMLRRGLGAAYDDYAARTRRLVPGLW